jgi:ATP-dependent RNA helicase HelY
MGLPGRQPPDPGFVWAAHKWTGGGSLAAVLAGGEMTAGDFVRWCKQVIDFLGQLGVSQDDDPQARALAELAADAVRLMRRGVVAVSSIAELGDSSPAYTMG